MDYCIEISTRQSEVLHLIANEYTSFEIAERLYLSHDTVKSHRRDLLGKFRVRNSAGLVRKAFELGILSIPVK